MIITRCDECKKLSDEAGVGYIGKKWKVSKYRENIMIVSTMKDLCKDCVKKLIAENNLSEQNADEY